MALPNFSKLNSVWRQRLNSLHVCQTQTNVLAFQSETEKCKTNKVLSSKLHTKLLKKYYYMYIVTFLDVEM